MNRIDNWPSAMYKAIEAKATQPFIWGQYDCCLFVCDIVYAITGVDMAEDFRGKYDSKDGAFRLIKRMKEQQKILEDFVDEMAPKYGFKTIPITFGGRGDMALFQSELGDTMGIFDGALILSIGYKGMVTLPREVATRAWRI